MRTGGFDRLNHRVLRLKLRVLRLDHRALILCHQCAAEGIAAELGYFYINESSDK